MLTDGDGWDGADGLFWQGGVATAARTHPTASMRSIRTPGRGAAAEVGPRVRRPASIARAWAYYYVTDAASGLSGFTTYIPLDGYPAGTVPTPWYEGGFGVALALRGSDGAPTV